VAKIEMGKKKTEITDSEIVNFLFKRIASYLHNEDEEVQEETKE
jgi:hypothetical protein